MTYAKPEVAILGDARVLIETIRGKVSPGIESLTTTPAYDLDD